MKCPACDVELTMSERQGIEIDYCPKCRGVWLDRGELDKIIERTVTPANVQPEPYREHHENEHDPHYKHGYGKRKKSFLENIFD